MVKFNTDASIVNGINGVTIDGGVLFRSFAEWMLMREAPKLLNLGLKPLGREDCWKLNCENINETIILNFSNQEILS